jgi:hypothetical protein
MDAESERKGSIGVASGGGIRGAASLVLRPEEDGGSAVYPCFIIW